ncbi:cadmium-translocating P-type ATPase [Clostridium sporogenes]|jgi:Cu2+-exporting ATPase|uniref:heavy metal translocating P-type ATPase n=1 Tax=Clostridium sporogenes TaxID=1509 RepID=UPI0015EE4CDC|nr:heavy metal translocating P-type ATPase [Clostridium sporogenes]MBA4507521.1 cadmium-translocating P-type ATPase [Clostridium sporogenes]
MSKRKDNSQNNNSHTHHDSNNHGHHDHVEGHNHEMHNHSEHNHENHNEHGNHHEHHEHNQHHEHHGHHGDHEHHEHHGGHDHHHHGNFKELFLKSLPLAIPILILSPMMGLTLPFQFTFQYSDILVGILSTILLIYGGKPFYQGAIDEFKQKSPGMMALVSLGISVSYLYSIYAVIIRYTSGEHVMDFFFEFASLVLIMLLGHWIEMKAVGDAGDAQKSLAELLPKDAHVVLEDDSIEIRSVTELVVGDIVRVQAGENVPADGVIVRGESRVNEALLTGESKPVEKNIDDIVIGGSTNGEGILYIKVQETGDKSFISQVQTLISQAQNQPSRAEGLANKVAGLLFYIAVIVAAIAFVIWLIITDLQTAIIFTVTTLVIACPHALGLAIPLVVARSTSLGASRGLLVKDREALELANKADVMVLDKTGTLTTGEFKVLALDVISSKYSKDEVTALIAGIEGGSSHPIAQSIVNYANEQVIKPINFDSIDIISGAGVEGKVNGKHYRLISQKAYGKELNIEVPVGATLSIFVEEGEAIGSVALGDELKETSAGLIKALKANGIEPIMATGDNEKAAKAVAEKLGIKYKSNQSPQDKYELVESLKKENKTVIMVGDGVNDAPSLALADVGVAVGAGTQVAIDSADIILTQSDPGDIESFLELSKKTTRKMRENLVWGAGYNFIAIPLAAGILAPVGISLTPAVGAILMSLSTVIVAINAMMLKLDN